MMLDLRSSYARSLTFLAGGAVGAVGLQGCEWIDDATGNAEDTVEEALSSEVKGRVKDNRGEDVEGATVRLYDLLDNTDFVEDSDIGSLEAYIDREAVLSSDNDLRHGTTMSNGRFSFETHPSAFLAVATKDGCSAGFAGFDEETGVLDADTLIKPEFEDGLSFSIPTFVLACADPPEVSPDGNSDEAPPFEPEPPPPPGCDEELCTAAGGECEEDACAVTCIAESCEQGGGTCIDGECVVPPTCDANACAEMGGECVEDACVTPSCDEAQCTAARGTCSSEGSSCDIPPCFAAEIECTDAGGACSGNGTTCQLPACSSDEDCEAGQPGAWCDNPGDVELAACMPPAPGEITPPMEMLGWTELRVTDAEGNLLADASEEDQRIAGDDIPEDGLVRVYGKYSGDAETAYIQVQSGGQECPRLRSRTDFIEVALEDGVLASTEADYVELVLHGGCQKIQLSTSKVLGEGERSFVVGAGDRCAPPRDAFIAILTWRGGRHRHADLDLNVWNGEGELVHVGHRRRRWGWLRRHGRGPGPEVFVAHDASDGPFTVKVQFFSGRRREVSGKLRVIRVVDGQVRDESFTFTVNEPKDVAEIGVFAVE